MTTTTAAPQRFSIWELAYLLAGREEATARRARELVGIPEASSPEDAAFSAGQSSLALRGMLADEDGALTPVASARIVGYGFGAAERWVALTAIVDGEPDSVFLLEAPSVRFMVRPAPGDCYDVFPLGGETGLAVGAEQMVRQLASSRETVDVIVKAAGAEHSRALFLSVSGGEWRFGEDVIFPGDARWPAPDLETRVVTPDEASAAIIALVSETS